VRRNTYAGGYGTRYRGSRGGGGKVLLLLAVAVLAAAALWLGRSLLPPKAAETTPTPIPTAAPTPEPEPTPTPMREKPKAVKGVYVSGPVAGDPYMDTILQLIDDTELNAVVIDVKNDEGQLTYIAPDGTAKEIGACVRFIPDLPGLLEKLKEHGVYTIARVVAFKDPILAEAKPQLALRTAQGKSVSESGGPAWVDPFSQEVWNYLAEIALDAADVGFDEVQFDYVRFAASRDAEDLALGEEAQGKTRADAVDGFLGFVKEKLREKGVWLSADVFGTVITNRGDGERLGQDYARMGKTADVLCPMVYPSHYAAGSFGLDVPDAQPYETVLGAMEKSREVLLGLSQAERPIVRPWLQDFTASWVRGHISYGAEEVRSQIQAVYDAGYTEWILWNAQNRYTAGALENAG